MQKLKIHDINNVIRVWLTLNGHTLELPRVASVTLDTMERYEPDNHNYRAEIEFNGSGCTIVLTDCEVEFGVGLQAIDFFDEPTKYVAET